MTGGENRELRRAFTLVELLVVVVIIGILVSLLLPAVQMVREAARRTLCSNNLKQIGAAFQEYESNYRMLPDGGYGCEPGDTRTWVNGAPGVAGKQQFSWPYQILPMLEQTNLWYNPSDQVVRGTPVSTYFCPTRRRPVAIHAGPWSVWPFPVAQTDYAGNAGYAASSGAGAYLNDGSADGVVIQQNYFNSSASQPPTVSAMTIQQIMDGVSCTLLVGEKLLGVDVCSSQNQACDNDGYCGGFQDDVARWCCANPAGGCYTVQPDFHGPPLSAGAALYPKNYLFGSSHSSGAQFVLCDGSVHMISFTVDQVTFQHLAQRNDGQPADPSKW